MRQSMTDVLTLRQLELRRDRVQRIIPEANGEYRLQLEANLADLNRMITLWRDRGYA